MPTVTYTPLANTTLGSNAATVTFSSISQSYKDLVLIISQAREAADNGASMLMRFNSNSTGVYNTVQINGNGSTTGGGSGSDNAIYLSFGQGMSITNPSSFIVNIMDYSTTNKEKTVVSRHNMPSNSVGVGCSRYSPTAAVSSITLLPFTGSIAAGTNFSLYGILA